MIAPLDDGWTVPHIAIIGAGMAGLACAQALRARGYGVTLLDKGRAPGGRLSTRRQDDLRFDHGSPWLLRRSGELGRWQDEAVAAKLLTPLDLAQGGAANGEVRRWDEPMRALAGRPGLSALPRGLAQGFDMHLSTRVIALHRQPDRRWLLEADGIDQAFGPFDGVIVTCPAPQAHDLLIHTAPALAEATRRAAYSPRWVTMVAFPRRLALPMDVLWPEGEPVALAVRDSAKPDRIDAPDCWMLQATAPWSRRHLEEDAPWVAAHMLEGFLQAIGPVHGQAPVHLVAHRWRYAQVEQAVGEVLVDDDLRLGIAGDWCLGCGVEAAFLSGRRTALLMHLTVSEQLLRATG